MYDSQGLACKKACSFRFYTFGKLPLESQPPCHKEATDRLWRTEAILNAVSLVELSAEESCTNVPSSTAHGTEKQPS